MSDIELYHTVFVKVNKNNIFLRDGKYISVPKNPFYFFILFDFYFGLKYKIEPKSICSSTSLLETNKNPFLKTNKQKKK